jgi:hypothetical protein
MKILSFLPVFNGFYGTWFECNDEENYIEDDFTFDDYIWDYKKYYNEVSENCVSIIETKLNELGFGSIKIKFDNLYSPREYNFTNDSINCTYTLNKTTLKNVYLYLKENKEAFEVYIKEHFTSYSGFSSFYSNDVNVWLKQGELDVENDAVILGTLFDFILLNDGYTDSEMADDAKDGVYIYSEYKNKTEHTM